MKLQKLLLPLFVFLVFSLKASIANTTTFATVKIYVNENISNQSDGTSWNTAFKSLDDAITAAKNLLTTNAEVHIWVQKGNYKTTATSLPNNLHLYGGFAGSETNLSERTSYVTTLSNATIVSPLIANTGLFTIDASTNIKINGIVFKNLEDTNGLSTILKIDNNSSDIYIEHCLFDTNKNATGGAALTINNSDVSISYSKFSNNTVSGDGNSGGAVKITSSTVNFYASTFSRNSSDLGFGGALFATGNTTTLDFKFCNFIANKADKGASAIYLDAISGTVNFLNTVTSFNRIEQENPTKFGALHASGNANGLTVNLENPYTVFTDNWKKVGASYQFSASISSENTTINNINSAIIDGKKSTKTEPVTYFDKQDKKETRQMIIKPFMTTGAPTNGEHKKVQFTEFAGTSIYHTIYLPENWDPNKKYPVIVDIPGNPFNHQWGDYSSGKPESSAMGFSVTNANAIAITLPILNTDNNAHTNQLGDVKKTVAYIKKAMASVVKDWGGDPARIILNGYSRGGVGTSFLGKYDDEIADIWLAWLHYDGYDFSYGPTIDLREFTYNVEADDWEVNGGIARRFARTKGRNTFIAGSGFSGAFQDYNSNFNYPIENYGTSSEGRNHNPIWASGDNSLSEKARIWYQKTTTELSGTVSFTGKLISLTTGLPIENAEIVAGITRFNTTTADGSFSFEGLPKGTRTFTITLPNNTVETREITIDANLNQDIKICESDAKNCYTEGIPVETLNYFYYNIFNKGNAKGIKTTDNNDSSADNVGVTIFSSSDVNNQKIKFVKTSFSNEFYMQSNTGKYVTSINSTNENKVTLQSTIISGEETKYRWKIIKSDETDVYFIKNVGSDSFVKSLSNDLDNAFLSLNTLAISDEFKWKLNLKGTIDFKCSFTVDGVFEEICEKEVDEGTTVKLSVSPNEQGTWSWTGPNNFTATTQEITINEVDASKSGVYTVTFKTEANTAISKNLTLRVISYHTPAVSGEGFYRFINNSNNKSIRGYDGNSGSTYFGYADNAGVTIYTDNNVWASLRWIFLSSENKNEFYLTNVGSGSKYLTSIDPTNENKATLQTTIIESEKDKFLWLLIKTSTEGIYLVKNKATNLYLNSDANASNNNYITLVDFNATKSIEWNLLPTVSALKCSVQIDNNQEDICDSNVLIGESITLSPKPDVRTGTWSWTGPNGFTASTRVITLHTIAENDFGDYKVTYTPDSSTDELTLNFTISNKALSLDTIESENTIRVYPNPIHNLLKIDLGKYVGKSAEIKIFSLLGQEIFSLDRLEITSKIIEQEIGSEIKKGVYFIKINIDGKQEYQQKIIVD